MIWGMLGPQEKQKEKEKEKNKKTETATKKDFNLAESGLH